MKVQMSARNSILSALDRLGLRRPLGQLRRTASARARRWRDDAVARRDKAATLHLVGRGIAWELPWGDPHTEDIAVIVCLWNRPERLEAILALLDAQESGRRIRLVLWNNEPGHSVDYRSTLRGFTPRGALRSVEFVESARNIGGIGRFVAARDLVRRGYSGAFLMLDDDQDVTPRFVDDLVSAWTEHSVVGLWAWRTHTSYWDREQVLESGAPADHIGTGGSACDSRIVADEGFFRALPARFLFMEDMWMSACAAASGWRLAMVDTPVSFVLSHLDQGHHIRGEKEQFFEWIRAHRDRLPPLAA